MKHLRWIAVTALTSITFLTPPSLSQDAYTIAERVLVRIDTPTGSGGSGVIVERDNNRYTIVTNCHVLQKGGSGTYRLTTYRQTYTLNITNPQSLCYPNQIDLANLTLTTNDTYTPATWMESTLQLGQRVIAVGFPGSDGTSAVRDLEANSGEITRLNSQPRQGYDIAHSAETFQGMSGGGIFNEQGELIAISGVVRLAPDLRPGAYRFYGISKSFYSRRSSPPESPVATVSPSPTPRRQPTPTSQAGTLLAATGVPQYGLIAELPGHQHNIESVAVSSDGRTLVTGSFKNDIKIWNLNTGELQLTLPGHQYDERGIPSSNIADKLRIAISPDGRTLVSGVEDTIKIWNLNTGELQRTLTTNQPHVLSLAISPDGRTLVTGSQARYQGNIKIWNFNTGELQKTLRTDRAWSLVISPDGRTLVSGVEDTIKFWNLNTGELQRTLRGHENSVLSLAISPDGRTLVSGSIDETIKVWNLNTGQLRRTIFGHETWIHSVAITPDSSTLISGGFEVKIWNLSTGELQHTFPVSTSPRSKSPLVVSPDGRTLVTGSYDHTIKLLRLQ